MLIAGLQKSSLLDYPQKIAAILFTQGCNFRCGYCHNPELLQVNQTPQYQITVEEFLAFLDSRKGKLDGVVITGGEPCLQKDLAQVIAKIKEKGFLVKLDTNGTSPLVVENLLKEQLLDYIAMDIKAPLEKYPQITGVQLNIENVKKSIDLILSCGVDYEFRTTVLKKQLSFDDFKSIGQLIQGAQKYYLQKFVPSKIYDQSLMEEETYSSEEFKKIKGILEETIQFVAVR